MMELPNHLIPWHTVKKLLKRAWEEGYNHGATDVGLGLREEELTPNPYQEDK